MTGPPRIEYSCGNCADGPITEETVVVIGHEIAEVECPECGEYMHLNQNLGPAW